MNIIRKIIPKNPINSQTQQKMTERIKEVLEVFGKYYISCTKKELIKNKEEDVKEKEEREAFIKKDIEKKTKYYKNKNGEDEEVPKIPEPPEKGASLDTIREYCIQVHDLGFKPVRPRGKIEPKEPPKLQIEILRFIINDPSFDPYAVYLIRASKGKLSAERERRFKEFEKLHSKIKKLIPKDKEKEIVLPEASSKVGTRNLNENFLEERVKHLGEYLQKLAEVPEIQQNEYFLCFIGLHVSENPLDDQIFDAAYEKTRWYFWYIPRCTYDRKEEALKKLLTIEVFRSIKSDIQNALPPSKSLQKTSLKLAHKIISTALDAAVPPAWDLAYKGSGPVRQMVQEALGKIFEKIISERNKINGNLKENMLKFFEPIKQAFSELLTNAAPKVLPPILQPFNGIIIAYTKECEPLLLESFNNCDKNKLKQAIQELNKYHEELVRKLNEEVDKQLENICKELKGAFSFRLLHDCFNPMNVIGVIISDLVRMLNPNHWGRIVECLFKYKNQLKSNENNIDDVLQEMESDAKYEMSWEGYRMEINACRLRNHLCKLEMDNLSEICYKLGIKAKKQLFKKVCRKFVNKFSDYVWGFNRKKTDDKSWSDQVDEAFMIAYQCARKKFQKECGEIIKKSINDILQGMVLNDVTKEIQEKIKPFTEKAAELVPEQMKDLIDIEDLANEDIEETLAQTFENGIDEQEKVFVSELDKVLQK